MSKQTTIKPNVRQLIHLHSGAFHRSKITGTKIDKNSKPFVQRRNLQCNLFHLVWPAPSSHQKGTVIIVRLSLVEISCSEVKALGRGYDWFQFFNQTDSIKFLAFDTNNLLLFLIRNGKVYFRNFLCSCSSLFPSILAQAISKKPETSGCCRGTKWRGQLNVEMASSANQGQVLLPLDQPGVSNFALGGRKIKKKMPPVSTNQHLVILHSML